LEPDPTELVEANGEAAGRFPGNRAAHAKGTVLSGSFTPSERAGELTRAAHMQDGPVRTTVRFSNGGANPEANDAEMGDGRGMAVKFYLEDGTTDIVALSLPLFHVRTPAEFREFALARAESMEKVGQFIGSHPATASAIQLIVPRLVPPLSYAAVTYNSIHAFRLLASDGSERWIRWRWVPEAGNEDLPEDEREGMAPNYLQEDIVERAEGDGVRFTLVARIGQDGDVTDDPTVMWPDGEREEVEMGTLEITGRETARETGNDVMVMDPTRVTDGIETSDDPILHVRSHAYSVSVERRSGVPRPA
jgi:catalase